MAALCGSDSNRQGAVVSAGSNTSERCSPVR